MNQDRICLNCKHWQAMLKDSDEKMLCRLGKGFKNPTDSCSHFVPKSTFDSLCNPSRFIDDRLLK